MTERPEIFVDGDACPVRDEVFRTAARLGLVTHVVSNGARGVRLPESPDIRRVIVEAGADAADDWIAEHIRPGDVCATSGRSAWKREDTGASARSSVPASFRRWMPRSRPACAARRRNRPPGRISSPENTATGDRAIT